MPRNRVITSTQSLFVSDNATGVQSLEQIYRVQGVNHSESISRTPVTQYGQLAPIDQVILEPGQVSLDFSYLVTNALNESNLGLVVDGSANTISGLLDNTSNELNYYIITVPEGEDAVGGDAVAANEVIGIGNGFLSNYSFEAQVGSFPTASITIEALNAVGYASSTDQASPAINPQDGTRVTGLDGTGTEYNFTIPTVESGVVGQATALRPGDVFFSLANPVLGVDLDDAKIQSVRMSIDLAREPLNKLGSHFAFSKEMQYPINATLSVEANVGDLTTGSLSDILCNDQSYNLSVGIRKPACTGQGEVAIQYSLLGAKLDSQSFSSSVGGAETVSLQWTAQVDGPRSTTRGLFISGVLD